MSDREQVVLITGAAGGIGEATAKVFAGAGARVIGSDIAFEAPTDEKDILPFRRLYHDIANEESWIEVLADIRQNEGPIDVLVNNAGVALGGPISQIDLEDWRWLMQVNLDGTFLGLKHGILEMNHRGGNIINVSSALAEVGRPMAGAVGASKAAIMSLTRTAALEMAASKRPIRVNAVLPGGVDTGIFKGQGWWPSRPGGEGGERLARADIISETPMLRLGAPDEIAHVIFFLASEKASFITGAGITVDGGFTAA